jgi:hypothetical protein
MRTYCTLFDKNYLYQGVALYESLRRFSSDFKLYALCMDPVAHRTIAKMNDESLVPVSVEDLLTPHLSALRDRTTHGQFCWACQPFLCEFVLSEYGHDMVTYLEADSLFFYDPEILFDELADFSISLVPHGFSPEFDQTRKSGVYCVQFNTFRRDATSSQALNYWKDRCFEYTKEKPLAYPGQLCLNDWPKRFDRIKVIENPGAGVAPWNVQHRTITYRHSVPYVDGVPVVFYHFHQYGRYEDGRHELGVYPLTRLIVESIYGDYVRALAAAEQRVRSLEPDFHYRKTYKNVKSLRETVASLDSNGIHDYIESLKRKARGTFNVFPDEFFFPNR